MKWVNWIIVLLAITVGGWFLFDGIHALTTGDYVTPQSGPYAGQLGPWSKVVAAIGLEPRSTVMKWIFVAYGAAWMACMICFIVQPERAWRAMLIAAIGALWYLPFGTLLSVIQIILLHLPRVHRRPRHT